MCESDKEEFRFNRKIPRVTRLTFGFPSILEMLDFSFLSRSKTLNREKMTIPITKKETGGGQDKEKRKEVLS